MDTVKVYDAGFETPVDVYLAQLDAQKLHDALEADPYTHLTKQDLVALDPKA